MAQLTEYRKPVAAVLVIFPFIAALLLADDQPVDQLRSDKAALSPLQGFVGKWKGTGFLRRGSARGSWRQETTWAWKFSDGRASLEFTTPQARFLNKGNLKAAKEKGRFLLNAELPRDAGSAFYGGTRTKEGALVLDLLKPGQKGSLTPARIKLNLLVGGKRLVVLYEGKNPDSGRYYRLGEVGYTLSGTTIASGTGQPECIVTGGRGTLRVEHKGKSYTVCCKGCLEAFRDDPGGIVAEWKQRKKEELERRKIKKQEKTESR